jgi:hypothetical protein
MEFEWIGWVATVAFAGSYRCKDPVRLRRVQALAACIWVIYGAVIGAAPVLAANLLVAGVAGWSSLRPLAVPKAPPASGAQT